MLLSSRLSSSQVARCSAPALLPAEGRSYQKTPEKQVFHMESGTSWFPYRKAVQGHTQMSQDYLQVKQKLPTLYSSILGKHFN